MRLGERDRAAGLDHRLDACCRSGIVGSFPALNARESDGEPPLLDAWLTRIAQELDDRLTRQRMTLPELTGSGIDDWL